MTFEGADNGVVGRDKVVNVVLNFESVLTKLCQMSVYQIVELDKKKITGTRPFTTLITSSRAFMRSSRLRRSASPEEPMQ